MEVAQNAINFLSTLSKYQTRRCGIQNRVATISRARKVVGKHRMLDTVHAKIYVIDHKIKELIELFKPLVSRGVPFFWEVKGPLLSQKEYLDQLVICRSYNSRFRDMQQAMSRKAIFDKLAGEFELLSYFKATCATIPDFSYTKTMELKVLAHDMVVANFLGPNQWRSIQQYGSNKFRLQS